MSLLDRLRGRRGGPELAVLPRATGPARRVNSVVSGDSTAYGTRYLPVDGLEAVGTLVGLDLVGPRRFRPGEAPSTTAEPYRRVAELTMLEAGSLEHRDSLGHRGQLTAPAVRLLSGGAGVIAECAWSREVRREGGDLALVTVRWAQPAGVAPTVRLGSPGPPLGQGRSRVHRVVAPDGVVPAVEGLHVLTASVAAGATLDLPVIEGDLVVVVVRSGEVLLGDALDSVEEGHLARLDARGRRLSLATRLDDERGADVIVITQPEDLPLPVLRKGWLLADDEDELAAAEIAASDGRFGRLPRLDD